MHVAASPIRKEDTEPILFSPMLVHVTETDSVINRPRGQERLFGFSTNPETKFLLKNFLHSSDTEMLQRQVVGFHFCHFYAWTGSNRPSHGVKVSIRALESALVAFELQ